MFQVTVLANGKRKNCYLSPTSIGAETDEQLIASIKNSNGIWTPIFEQLSVNIDDKDFNGSDYSIESYVKVWKGKNLVIRKK